MSKVLTLYSSARPDGNTFQHVNTFNQLVPGEICYLDSLEIAQYDYQFRNQNDDFSTLIDNMLNVDVIILASPVYWYSLTPTMRRFFDRLTDLTELPELKAKGKKMREKSFYLFATSVHPNPPASFTFPVEKTLEYLGWRFMDSVHLDCKEGFSETLAISSFQQLAEKLRVNVEKHLCPLRGSSDYSLQGRSSINALYLS